MFTKVSAKDPSIKRIINATFPSYKKHNVYLNPTMSVTLHGLNWSGGSKSDFEACTIEGKSLPVKHDMSAPAPWENPFEGKTIELPENTVIVEGGVFCGKQATLMINVHPSNMARLLTV